MGLGLAGLDVEQVVDGDARRLVLKWQDTITIDCIVKNLLQNLAK